MNTRPPLRRRPCRLPSFRRLRLGAGLLCFHFAASLLCGGEPASLPANWAFLAEMPDAAILAGEAAPGVSSERWVRPLLEAGARLPPDAPARPFVTLLAAMGPAADRVRFSLWADESPASFQMRIRAPAERQAVLAAVLPLFRAARGEQAAAPADRARYSVEALPGWPVILESFGDGLFLHTAMAGERFAARPGSDLLPWVRAMNAAEPGEEGGAVLLRLAFFADRIPAWSERAPHWKRAAEITGFDHAGDAVFCTLFLGRGRLGWRAVAVAKETPRRLLRFCFPDPAPEEASLPAGALAAWRTPSPPVRLLETVGEMETAFDAAVGAEFRAELSDLDRDLGFSLRETFLPLFPRGGRIALVASDAGGTSSLPPWAVRAPCADAGKAEALLHRWAGAAGWTIASAPETDAKFLIDETGTRRAGYAFFADELQIGSPSLPGDDRLWREAPRLPLRGAHLLLDLRRLADFILRRNPTLLPPPGPALLESLARDGGRVECASWHENALLCNEWTWRDVDAPETLLAALLRAFASPR